MELPKNITQIGESNPHCKIYVEDYAVSYIKQLNYNAGDKQQAVGLYGRKTEENGITYLFLYGACRLHFLQRESRHLSQAVMLEAEKMRKKYFLEHQFLAYCVLQGEMVEGFYVCDQATCRYIEGYAKFFEKNDSMLSFMLVDREEEAQPEVVDQEKYEEVRKRQEERRQSAERSKKIEREGVPERRVEKAPERRTEKNPEKSTERKMENVVGLHKMRWAVAAVFALVCVAGLVNLGNREGFENLQMAARQAIEALTEQKLPDQVQSVNASAHAGTIVAEDKLTEALRAENASGEGESASQSVLSPEQEAVLPTVQPTAEPTPEPTVVPTLEPTPSPTAVPTAVPTPAPVSYVVQSGDTLSAICWRVYGSDAMLGQICKLNGIDNPDNIKIGQKILLPQ